jgi:hypothetical protein
MLRAFLLASIALAACTDEPLRSCSNTPRLFPATGSGPVASGILATGAQDQRIVVSSDRQFLEYTFTRDGKTITARYALSETPPTLALKFVLVKRPPPLATCAALDQRGPVIDAVEVRRGGTLVSVGTSAYYTSARCETQEVSAKAPTLLDGAADGVGAPLSDNDLGWAMAQRFELLSGDEVTVTVLDGSGGPFEVYAGREQTSFDLKLGTLTGTGTFTVP